MKKKEILKESQDPKCNRLNALLILEVLRKYSNKEHPLGRSQIISHILDDYDIQIAPHTVNAMVNFMSSFECAGIMGKELISKGKDGYYLTTQRFSSSEVEFLTHAIYSSRCLSPSIATGLVHKINDEVSEFDKLKVENLFGSPKTENNINNIFDTIKEINNGINLKRQISFYYCTFDINGNLVSRSGNIRVTVNPYCMVNNRGAYYLISSELNGDDIKTYRVDFMSGVEIEKASIWPIEKLKAYEKDKFSLKDYVKDHVYFADSNVVDAQIVIHQSRTIGAVKDWFGNSAKIYSNGNQIIANIRNDEQALFFWCMQYCKEVTAIEPISLVEKIKAAVHELSDRYENQKIDDKQLKTLDRISNKYNIYLDVDDFKFTWDSATITDFYYEISGTKEGTLKPIASILLNESSYLTTQNHIQKPYYLLSDGRARLVSLIIFIVKLCEVILLEEPDNKEVKVTLKKYRSGKVNSIPGMDQVLALNYENLLKISSNSKELFDAFAAIDNLLTQRQNHFSRLNQSFFKEALRLLNIATNAIAMKVNVK